MNDLQYWELLSLRDNDFRRFAGANQPPRRDLGIDQIHLNGEQIEVRKSELAVTPFVTLVEYARSDAEELENILVVPPLSGHFAILLRDLVVGLLSHFRVTIVDWSNVRHVSLDYGKFDFDANVLAVHEALRILGPRTSIVAVCQGGVAALAATALLSMTNKALAPSALVIIGAPINPLANPTKIVDLLRSKPVDWFKSNFIDIVGADYTGHGRLVFPASCQLGGLATYLVNRFSEGGELFRKFWLDDGCDPVRFPFLDLYTSIMDIDAAHFIENVKCVYQDCDLARNELRIADELVDVSAIRETALITIEGEWDDIAAPGQTSAAHELCVSLPSELRGKVVLPGAGHFSLFHGALWRRRVLPSVLAFLADFGPRAHRTRRCS